MATLKEILSMDLGTRKSLYEAKGIDKVIIDGITFSGYGVFSFIWEKSYVKEPTRSGDGTIGNLNSYATFLTPHLKINFSMMSIDDYRTIMTLIEEKNEFLVTCYDVVHKSLTQNKMYFTTEEMPKLFYLARALNGEEYVELLGIEDYTVEMVGTNAPKDEINIVYYGLDGTMLVNGSTSGVENTEFIVGEGLEVPDIVGYTFSGTWTRNGVKTYINNEEYRLKLLTQEEIDSKTIAFYADKKADNTHILSLSYGLGKPLKDDRGAEITAIDFMTNDTISMALSRANISLWEGGKFTRLPISPNPTKQENGKVYETHTRKGWYETATIPLDEFGNLSAPLTDSSQLLVNGDMIIYELFVPVKNSVSFQSNGGTNYSDLSNVDYGSNIALPTPYRQDYVFLGWYTDKDFSNKFEGIMPPYSITLYAQWEKTSK
jgi:uncharacterized repeat protein (TIGR02543 family)